MWQEKEGGKSQVGAGGQAPNGGGRRERGGRGGGRVRARINKGFSRKKKVAFFVVNNSMLGRYT